MYMFELVRFDRVLAVFRLTDDDSFEIISASPVDELKVLNPLIIRESDLVDYLNSRRTPFWRSDRSLLFGSPYKGLDYEVRTSFLTALEDGVFVRPVGSKLTFEELERGVVDGKIPV